MKKTNPSKSASLQELLALRKQIKTDKPDFIRQDYHKKLRLAKNWRKPKGLHSKVRENRRGYVSRLKRGYGSPVAVKGLHHSGLEPILVTHLGQLKKMDKAKQGIVFSGKLGAHKKITLIQEAEKAGIKVLNLDPVKYKVKVTERLKERQQFHQKYEEKKEQAKKVLDKKVEADKKEEKIVDDKEKKENERREAEKVLTQKK
ncbi:MAG: 50S ribosomal protein L32e [Nanoarchaeota archaeon]